MLPLLVHIQLIHLSWPVLMSHSDARQKVIADTRFWWAVRRKRFRLFFPKNQRAVYFHSNSDRQRLKIISRQCPREIFTHYIILASRLDEKVPIVLFRICLLNSSSELNPSVSCWKPFSQRERLRSAQIPKIEEQANPQLLVSSGLLRSNATHLKTWIALLNASFPNPRELCSHS